MIFCRFWKPSEALLGGLGGFARGLGRLGQGLERLNCILDVSWVRLRRFGRRLEANLKRLGGFRKPFEDAKGRPRPRFKSVQKCFWSVFWNFSEAASTNCQLVRMLILPR